MDNLFFNNTSTFFNRFYEPSKMAAILIIAVSVYALLYALLQARQLGILKQKVKTPLDTLLTFSSLLYLVIQFGIFVLILVIL